MKILEAGVGGGVGSLVGGVTSKLIPDMQPAGVAYSLTSGNPQKELQLAQPKCEAAFASHKHRAEHTAQTDNAMQAKSSQAPEKVGVS